MIVAITLLAIGMLVLTISVIFLSRDVTALKRAQAEVIWLQLQQQLMDPRMTHALQTVQTLDHAHPSMNGNGHHPAADRAVLMNGQLEAMQMVNRYFANVGTLVRDGVVDERQVLAQMGLTLSEAYHASRQYRVLLQEKHAAHQDDFDWLYTEWLNQEHHQRAQSAPLR